MAEKTSLAVVVAFFPENDIVHEPTSRRMPRGEPRHVDVKGDFGYVVVPTTMAFDLKGQKIVQNGGVFTVALRIGDDGWRLTAWTWSKGSNSPA